MSKIEYYADFVVYPGLLIELVVGELKNGAGVASSWLCSIICGVVLWTLLEYLIHRFVFHSVGQFAEAHRKHHARPLSYVGTPTVISLLLVVSAGYVPALMLFDGAIANGLLMGIAGGYLWYLIVHDVTHRRMAWRPRGFGRVTTRHKAHHRQPAKNFGITTSFWDRMLGTYENIGADQSTCLRLEAVVRGSEEMPLGRAAVSIRKGANARLLGR